MAYDPQAIQEVMNSAYCINFSILKLYLRPPTGQHYTSSKNLAAYVKGLDPTNFFTKAITLESVTLYLLKDITSYLLKDITLYYARVASYAMLSGISYYAYWKALPCIILQGNLALY